MHGAAANLGSYRATDRHALTFTVSTRFSPDFETCYTVDRIIPILNDTILSLRHAVFAFTRCS